MTYEEIKNKLNKCERSLEALRAGTHTQIANIPVPQAITQLEVMKEALENELVILEQEKTAFVNNRAIEYEDEEELTKLKNNSDVESIKTAKGKRIKELLDLNETLYEGINLSMEETKAVAKKAGEALIKSLKAMGEGMSAAKAKKIAPGKFTLEVEFKNNNINTYEFTIDEADKLYLEDPDFRKMVGQIGVQPSGEIVLHVDIVAGNLTRAIQSNLGEDYDPDKEQKDDEEDHGVGYDDEGRPLGEGEGDDHHYLKVPSGEYKKAQAILDQNIDPTYVKMEVVDNDGAGNVIFYFIFKHEDGFDDMYDDSENPDSEFYQEPDEDPQAFIYDAVMDLRANDITVTDSSADLDEATNLNDPVLMKMRAAKDKLAKTRAANAGNDGNDKFFDNAKKIAFLKKEREQLMRDMEQEAEPEGGPIADEYGDKLNRIDAAIAKLSGRKEMDYDTAVGKVNEEEGHLVTFGYDLDRIEDVVKHLQSKYKEGQDFELHIGRGDDLPNAVTLKNPALEDDHDLNDMLNAAQSDQDRYDAYTDYDQRRKEDDDYYEDPDYYKESTDKDMLEKKRPGLWANINAKRKRGEKPAHKNSNAHKDAVAAGKKIKKEEVLDEASIAKIHKALDLVKVNVKKHLEMYKSGDDAQKKLCVVQLKALNVQKKQLEKMLDDKVAGTGKGQELDVNEYGGSAARDLDEIFGALGYRQGFDEFIEDNPGCVEVIMEWIGSIRDFQQTLSQEYDNEELENLGFYFGDDDEYNESLHEGRGDLDTIVRVITDMANEDGTTTKEAALEVIEAIRHAYMIDAFDEGVNESLNPEVSKKVAQFIKGLAKRYDYSEQDAVYAIMAALKQREFDGVNEDVSMKIGKVVAIKKYNAVKNQKLPVDVKITDYIKKPGSKDFVEYEHKGKKRKVSIDVFKSILAESKKTLKEYTDNSFKGSEVIDDANKRGPDMFGKQIFADLLPKGVASENDAFEALKKHDKSGIKARMGQYAPMFVHMQYHNLEHEGEKYRMHQKQYYNSNFKDRDPDFNPGVSVITLMKVDENDEGKNLGVILVKTDQYVQDLRNLPGLGKRHMEEATRQDLGMTSSVSKRRAKAELKKPGNDGSKVYGLDKDGKRVHIKNINDVDKFKKFELDADLDESGPGFAHDCAAKVVHETYGKGKCIPEKHTLVKEGKKYVVTHYDVLFESGKTVEDIPVSELDIKTTNEHWHKGYKKKKK